jgi:putative PIN family toxin of toxin-antitoxin system
MIRVVLDASVVISGCGWAAESYHSLVMVARRRIRSFVTDAIILEWRETLKELQTQGTKFRRDPWPTLEWLIDASHLTDASTLGKQRSRDLSDDLYVAAAVAAGANFIVSRDSDLLALEKPFGIEIATPRLLLSRIRSQF